MIVLRTVYFLADKMVLGQDNRIYKISDYRESGWPSVYRLYRSIIEYLAAADARVI